MLQTAIEILIEEMIKKGAKILGGDFTYQGKKYRLHLEEVTDEKAS